MDYYKNVDKLCDRPGFGRIGQPQSAVEGVSYTVVADLVAEPVTVDYFKQHARIDFNTDDNLVEAAISAAREYLESWAQLSFGEKTIRLSAKRLPATWQLMYGPVKSISTSGWTLFGKDTARGTAGEWVTIEYVTGWPDDKLPEVIKQAICRYAAGLYAIRENYILSVSGVVHEAGQYLDEAQKLLVPYMNVTFP